MSGEAPTDLDGLRREMWMRQRQARMAVRIYNRGTWIRFALVFIPVPDGENFRLCESQAHPVTFDSLRSFIHLLLSAESVPLLFVQP